MDAPRGVFTNIVIKSGTNESARLPLRILPQFGDGREPLLPARTGQKLVPYNANVYGGSVGGPIFIPKVYDGRNRTFFFFSYEGAHEGNGQGPSLSVPTLKMRQGDFSEFGGVDLRSVLGAYGERRSHARSPCRQSSSRIAAGSAWRRRLWTYWPLPNNPNVNPATPWVNNYVQSSKWPTTPQRLGVEIRSQADRQASDLRQVEQGDGFFNFNYDFPGTRHARAATWCTGPTRASPLTIRT